MRLQTTYGPEPQSPQGSAGAEGFTPRSIHVVVGRSQFIPCQVGLFMGCLAVPQHGISHRGGGLRECVSGYRRWSLFLEPVAPDHKTNPGKMWEGLHRVWIPGSRGHWEPSWRRLTIICVLVFLWLSPPLACKPYEWGKTSSAAHCYIPCHSASRVAVNKHWANVVMTVKWGRKDEIPTIVSYIHTNSQLPFMVRLK